jgi:putative cell wall-binding protein
LLYNHLHHHDHHYYYWHCTLSFAVDDDVDPALIVVDDDDCADDTVAHIYSDYANHVVADAVTDADSYSESGITVADVC